MEAPRLDGWNLGSERCDARPVRERHPPLVASMRGDLLSKDSVRAIVAFTLAMPTEAVFGGNVPEADNRWPMSRVSVDASPTLSNRAVWYQSILRMPCRNTPAIPLVVEPCLSAGGVQESDCRHNLRAESGLRSRAASNTSAK